MEVRSIPEERVQLPAGLTDVTDLFLKAKFFDTMGIVVQKKE